MLADALAAEFQLSIISEGVRRWVQFQGIVRAECMTEESKLQLQRFYLLRKMRLEMASTAFVSDRSVVDGIVISNQRLARAQRRQLASVLETCKRYLHSAYDLIVVPPFRYYGDRDPLRPQDRCTRKAEHQAIKELIKIYGLNNCLLRGHNVEEWLYEVRRAVTDIVKLNLPRRPDGLRRH